VYAIGQISEAKAGPVEAMSQAWERSTFYRIHNHFPFYPYTNTVTRTVISRAGVGRGALNGLVKSPLESIVNFPILASKLPEYDHAA